MINVIKKNGETQKFNSEKIKRAIRKSANRVCVTLSEKDEKAVVSNVKKQLQFQETDITVDTLHNIVEVALDHVNQDVAKSYREYRDNKNAFASMLDKVYSKKLSLNFIGDRSNANSDSALVTTQKAIVYNELNSELYKKFFLTQKEERAMSDGYIYVHDRGSRLDCINCCIFDMKSLITNGFFMGNLDYQEPKTLDVAFDLVGDVTMNAAASQYGGFTIPEVDKLFKPYAEKSYKLFYEDYMKIAKESGAEFNSYDSKNLHEKADVYATEKVRREFEQGFQSWEMKFNSVASSRGDYPFTAITFGLGKSKFETMCSSVAMKVRKEGQGNKGYKHPVLFPKINFFYDENLHGEGKELEWLFDEAIDCSSKAMYPDFISCTGEGYDGEMYKKYGKPISKMGCIDYAEQIEIASTHKGECKHNLMIGEFFKSIKDGRGVDYISNRVDKIIKNITNESDKKKFEDRGYIWCDSELMNQWAKDFKAHYGRRPTRGDVKEYFGYDLHRKNVRFSLNIDSKLFDLWDSYLEVKVVDVLKKNNFTEKHTISECTSDSMFVRNKMLRNKNGIAKQMDIYFPTRKLGIEVQDFTTHSRNDNEPYKINGSVAEDGVFKKGITYSSEKQKFFDEMGIKIIEIWEDDIRNNNYNVIANEFGLILETPNYTRKDITTVVDNSEFEMLDLDGLGIKRYIKDIDGNWVKVHKIIKNKNVTDWMCITLNNEKSVMVTSDHPFITEDGQLIASELFIGQNLISDDDELIPITDIVKINRVANSYDVETESGTFVFSGIQSHNCRANLSPWFVRGGMQPADENDYPVFEGRFNMGAISLHFPMIVAKAQKEDKDFYDVLTHYLEMARSIHQRTFDYLSHKKAGTNPLGFCQGGFLNGHKDPEEELGEDFLRPMTISFGITALNEASILAIGKTLVEDNSWAIEVMKFINEYVNRIKKEDNILYAIYGTPAESLCHLQIEQFRKKYGIIKNVSDHEYTSNSFHCCVREDITPIQKQDIEYPLYHLTTGGRIQYVKYSLPYNLKAIKDLVRRAMKMGFYEGINFDLDFCEDCGRTFTGIVDTCEKCGSKNITKIRRMNGYLSYESVRGKTMYADHKLTEFKERKSM